MHYLCNQRKSSGASWKDHETSFLKKKDLFERESGGEKGLVPDGSLPTWSQWPGLGQIKARSHEHHLGLPCA